MTASFTSSVVIAAMGMATLARARGRHEWLFASVPLLFALHQLLEGLVWLGLDGTLAPLLLHASGFAYVLYAQGILPLLMPLSIWLLVPTSSRKRRLWPLLLIGAGLAIYVLWALFTFDTRIYVDGHSVVYANSHTREMSVAVLYVIATCGVLLVSGYRYLMVLGVANLVGLLVVAAIKSYAFTSVWCAYAALISVLIHGHFHRARGAEKRGRVLMH